MRATYPALDDGHAYLDGAAGTQVPQSVIDAIVSAYRTGIGNGGGAFEASHRADDIVAACRAAVADLVGGLPDGVILGPNMTTLTYRLAGALALGWGPGDEVVVSRLDHDANVRPWIQLATRAGATIRWAEVDPATGELPVEQYTNLIGERTRLVAVTAASNVLGTVPDVAAITALAHAAGALTYVDGVHATAHGPVDIASWAPTSTPPAPTNGRARTSARSSPIRRCWRRSDRTSWPPPPTRCRSASRRVPRPSPTWPA